MSTFTRLKSVFARYLIAVALIMFILIVLAVLTNHPLKGPNGIVGINGTVGG